MAKTMFSAALRMRVTLRALHCCEYCKSQDKYSPHHFTIDHLLAQSLGGTSDFINLAYACFLCNRLKSNKLKVLDLISETWIPLFNPRLHDWKKHFSWNEDAT